MTDEEILEGLKAYTSKPEVIDKAIKGLKSLEAWEKVSKDLISRQAVVHVIDTIVPQTDETWYSFYQKTLKRISKIQSISIRRD